MALTVQMSGDRLADLEARVAILTTALADLVAVAQTECPMDEYEAIVYRARVLLDEATTKETT